MRGKDRDYWEKKFRKQAEDIEKSLEEEKEQFDKDYAEFKKLFLENIKFKNGSKIMFSCNPEKENKWYSMFKRQTGKPVNEKDLLKLNRDMKKINTIDDFIKYLEKSK